MGYGPLKFLRCIVSNYCRNIDTVCVWKSKTYILTQVVNLNCVENNVFPFTFKGTNLEEFVTNVILVF